MTRTASRDLFCCPTTPAPTSTAPRGEDVLEDVLGQPWEETMPEQITALCQITPEAFDVGRRKFGDKQLSPRTSSPACGTQPLQRQDGKGSLS